MRVLIADDDLAALLLLKSVLEDWGYEVVTARDGTQAWDLLRRADSPPLAILDWIMPGLDGIDVCRKVRQNGEAPYVYLILLTGKVRTQDVVQGMESGADDYVSKPFEEQELKVRLRAGRRIVELHEALRTQATRDPLTGTWNRRTILEILHRESARAERDGTSLGVIMADIDHFKRLNDTLGHAAGDAALCEASRRMGTALRPYDALGRYGGEEFLIVLPGCDRAEVLEAAERVRNAVAEVSVAPPSGMPPVTISLGAATNEGASLDADTLIRTADEALYRAKRAGRNRVMATLDSKIQISSDS
ncbi:response regulator receiver modulated diguanylate cyclase [Singulisphaera sp. GP187]|uniref:GGDEF domain-containing response regulator n=1 Tax=Singulisphaera sp. GP187 TaxID=1882752 RepID=UPI0009276E0E|nr:diguanylate cyclase [Singulisphaera sp. GP187]SIO56255.1 response regulator receiver modulated diguanylate cyclase [Singulisphaera sp. GP187]